MTGMLVWVAVGVLGGAGALARSGVDAAVSARAGRGFPAGILVVNLTGAFALGVLAGAEVRGDARLLAGTALLGAYTTFSTWMLDTHRLGRAGDRRGAVTNLAGSLALGLLAIAAGRWIA